MENKDYIEEIILKNLKELNDTEPMEGHFARFEEKLKQQDKKSRFSFNMVWKVAAVAVFVFLAVNQSFIYFSNDNRGIFQNNNVPQGITLASVSAEYEEVEFYYTSSINSGLNQWGKLAEQGYISEEEQAMMSDELNDFEGLYKNLQKDLEANPNDERVINAMLEYYQAKLSVINMIVNKLEDVKQQKNSNNELNTTDI